MGVRIDLKPGSEKGFYNHLSEDVIVSPDGMIIGTADINCDITDNSEYHECDIHIKPQDNTVLDMDYNKADNKPSINGVELIGNKTNQDLGIPTKTSELENDNNYITQIPEEYAKKTDIPAIPTKISELDNDSEFISDYTETDPTVPEYVKNIKPTDITTWNNKSDFSGSYSDLTGKPTIPSIEGLASEQYVEQAIANIKSEPIVTVSLTGSDKRYISIEDLEKIRDTYLQEGRVIIFIVYGDKNYCGHYTVVEESETSLKCKSIDINYISTTTTNGWLQAVKNHRVFFVPKGEITKTVWISAAEGDQTNLFNIGAYAKTADVPTKVSELDNDSEYLTAVPADYTTNILQIVENAFNQTVPKTDLEQTVVTDKTYDAGKVYSANAMNVVCNDFIGLIETTNKAIPTKTSELTNDSGFITKDVNNLTNYFTKEEIAATLGDIEILLGGI